MICQRCRTGILSRLQQPQTVTLSIPSRARQFPIQRSQFRNYSDGKPTVSATPPPPTPRQPAGADITIPSAVSSATPGVSQPLSTPEGVHADVNPEKPKKAAVERPPSSCAAGQKMNGLNYFKNKPDVVALEDAEYPEWLWSLLDDSKKNKTATGGVDPSSMEPVIDRVVLFPCDGPLILLSYSLEQEAAQALREEDGRPCRDPASADPHSPSRYRYYPCCIQRRCYPRGCARSRCRESRQAYRNQTECQRGAEKGYPGGQLLARSLNSMQQLAIRLGGGLCWMGLQHVSYVQWWWLTSVEMLLWDMFNVFYATCTHIDSPDQALNGLYFRHTLETSL